MNVTSSQSFQINRPLDTMVSKRVNDASRASNSDSEKQATAADNVQQKQDVSVLRQLRARDREVRAHEAAHAAAGGSLVRGGPSYSFQKGPDGRSYAIGGEVQLDVSPVANDPQATLGKSSQIRAAALAPANPSPQDLRVAANANQLAARARVELAVQKREELISAAENQKTLEPDSPFKANEASNEKGVNQPFEITNQSSLKSNEPIAAISAFMATAQTESTPTIFNQFV